MRQNWLDSLVKGDKVYSVCYDGSIDSDVFDCWGNLNGSKGDGLYVEHPFHDIFLKTSNIFPTKKQAEEAGAKQKAKALAKKISSLAKELKRLNREYAKWQELAINAKFRKSKTTFVA